MGNNFHGFGNPLKQVTKPDANHPLLIALTGKFGAGKSTVSNYLVTQYGAKLLPFARNLKLEVYDALNAAPKGTSQFVSIVVAGQTFPNLPFPKLVLPTDDEKVAWINANKNTLRALLQTWGTEYRRTQDPDYWINSNVEAINAALAGGTHAIVVDDMRYLNEATELRKMGFKVVRVILDDKTRMARLKVRDGTANEDAQAHASEQEQDHIAIDYHVENSHELYKATRAIDKIVMDILNG